jgi:hypothetical protein
MQEKKKKRQGRGVLVVFSYPNFIKRQKEDNEHYIHHHLFPWSYKNNKR